MPDASDPREQLRQHLEWLGELGVDGLSRDSAWSQVGTSLRDVREPRRGGLAASAPDLDEVKVVPPSAIGATGATSADALDALRIEIGPLCTRCKLSGLGRRQVVFGVGNPAADLMFVGEAPGADEDVQGEPFVGRAGQLLTKMIEAMGQTRDTVYIANVIKCRPPENRNPEPDEVATCEPFLFRQIDIVRPKVIVALGKFAAQTLLRTDTPISKLRGQLHELRGAQLMPTFHPSYLLRSPDKKRDAWEDLKKVMTLLREGRVVSLVRVAVPVPGLGLLTYRLPDGQSVEPGARVVVPIGPRKVTGVVTHDGVSDADVATVRLRDVHEVLDDEPFLPPDVVRLALWVAEYYLAGPGDAVATALPPQGWLRSDVNLEWVGASDAVPADDPVAQLIEAQGAVLRSKVEQMLRARTADGVSPPRALDVARVIRRLEKAGLVAAHPVVTGKADASRRRRWVRLTAAALGTETAKLGRRQAEACALLRATPDGIDSADLRRRGIGSDTVRRLVGMGFAQVEWRAVERDPFASGVMGDATVSAAAADPSPLFLELTDEQRDVLDTLLPSLGAQEFQVALLQGVTGSGKTQVYLRLARACLEAGRTVLLLVPEIALTPAVARLFRAAFGSRVAIQHSGLSDGERYDQWHRIRRGDVDVVVGTRSAVFAPLPRLGLIIVDEEHDTAYKQEEAPRYSGRDAAVVRGRDAGALVVLGSATPSLESFRNASEGRYLSLRMQRRVLDRPLAVVRVVDMREQYATFGPDVVLSAPLVESLEHCLGRGEQAIVLLNRRGYAPSLFCRACGETVECPNCSVTLTVHRSAREVRCHYCNYARPLPRVCGSCNGEYLEFTGIGTERVEQAVATRFPSARIARVDRDTMTRRGAIARVLERFARREIDLLVGTQMIAKGHDFPQVTLVGVISADIGLGVADFRAAERTFQLLTQVAGRAGRGEAGGEALIQTLHPDHYAIVLASRQDYAAFTTHELEFRERMRYPPFVSMINVVIRHASLPTAMQEAEGFAAALRKVGTFAVLGPAPAPLGRLRGESRVQVFLKGRDRAGMRNAVRAALQATPDVARRATVDVDPLSML